MTNQAPPPGPPSEPSPPSPILARAIQIVGVLFAAFGGFLASVAPPDELKPALAFLTLGVLLLVSALARHAPPDKHKFLWLGAGTLTLVLFGGLGLAYQRSLLVRTFPFPRTTSTTSFVAGTELTADGRRYVAENPASSTTDMVLNFGGLDQRARVWTEASINRSRTVLLTLYLSLVVCVAATIFSFTEGLLQTPTAKP